MDESTAVAESSSAPEVQTVELPRSGTSEYAEWRIKGELPEAKPKTEESAPSDTSKETKVEPGEATPPRQQENRRKPDAEARIKELAAENKRLKAESEARKPEPPKPVQQATRQKPTPEDKNEDGTPKFKVYEDYVEELADWKAEQRMAAAERERGARDQQNALKAEVEKARSRYDNLDDVMLPALKTISSAQVSPVVMAMLNDSAVLPDLLYTIGSDQEDLAAFVKMAKDSPGKAIRYLAITENLIREELDKGTRQTPAQGADGKFTKTEPPPAKRGPESSPEPPLDIGNRGTGTMDESGRALSAIERGDPNAVRAWIKAENAKDLRRRRGV